jgi:hypothetical protein
VLDPAPAPRADPLPSRGEDVRARRVITPVLIDLAEAMRD